MSHLGESKIMQGQKSAVKTMASPVAGGTAGAFFMAWLRYIQVQRVEGGYDGINWLWPQDLDVVAPVVFAAGLAWFVRTVAHWRDTHRR